MTDLFRSMDITATALTAERTRLAVISQNIANASSLAGAPGEYPYRRQTIQFESVLREARDGVPVGGVRILGIRSDDRPFAKLYQPGHPAANEQGYVEATNVELPLEMVDLMDAARSYEANLSAIRVLRQMLEQTLSITR